MVVIVRDSGFEPEDWNGTFTDIGSGGDPEALYSQLSNLQMIRVDFPSFADGRGFTIAQRLRRMGYTGRLRAKGHVIADQFAMARRAGFDEIEISDELAARQTEGQWLVRANWRAHDYQSRLKQRA